MKNVTIFLLLSLFATPAMAQKYRLSELHCVLDNGVEMHGKMLSKTNKLEVDTEFFGLKKTFDAELIKFNAQGDLKSVIVLRSRDFFTPSYTLTLKLKAAFDQIQHTKNGEITNGLTLNKIVECTTEILELN